MNEIPDLYEVYYNAKHDDGLFYQRIGLVQRYSDEAKKWFAKGKLVVDDSILPLSFAVNVGEVTALEDVVPADFKPDNYMPIDSVISDAWHQYWSDKADKEAERLTKFGVGALVTRPVGDGSAAYVVTSMRKRGTECYLEWRGFCPDRWTDQMFGWGGWYRTKDIKPMAEFGKKELLFGSRPIPWQKTWQELEKLHLVPPGMIDHKAFVVKGRAA